MPAAGLTVRLLVDLKGEPDEGFATVVGSRDPFIVPWKRTAEAPGPLGSRRNPMGTIVGELYQPIRPLESEQTAQLC